MAAQRHTRIIQQSAFTLIEVLFAIAISAILMSAITLNVGVQPSLIGSSKRPPTSNILSARLDEIQQNQQISEIEALVGISATSNPLSDPSGTTDQVLVYVEYVMTGTSSNAVQVLAVNLNSGTTSLTRWLTPAETP